MTDSSSVAGREKTADRLAVAFLLLVPALLFADILFFGNTFFFRDLTGFYHPTKKVLREVALSGAVPYWDHSHSGGQPFAANPDYQVFYPLQALILLPSFELGYHLNVLIHIPIGLIGMYLLLRSIGLRCASALFGALSFGISGFFLSYVNLVNFLSTLAWLPWVLFFLRRYLIAPRIGSFAAAAAVLGLQLLAAEPTTILQTGVLMAALAFHQGFQEKGGAGRAVVLTMGRTALVIVAAISLAAIQILPLLDLTRDTARAGSLSFDLARIWSLPPIRALEIIAPQLLGPRGDSGLFLWGRTVYAGARTPYILSVYVGLFAGVVGLAGMFHGGAKWLGLKLLVLAGFVVAIGDHTPLLEILFNSGVFTMFRYPEKFVLLAVFPLIVLAALSFEEILAGNRGLTRTSLTIAALIAVLATALSLFAFAPSYGAAFARFWKLGSAGPLDQMIELSRTEWIMVAVRAFLVTALLAAVLRRTPRSAWTGAVLTFLLFDLGTHSWEVVDRLPATLLNPPTIAKQLPADRREYRLLHEAQIDTDRGLRLRSAGNGSFWFARNALLWRTPAAWGFSTVLDGDYDLTNLAPTRDLYEALMRMRDRGIEATPEVYLSISNVGFVATLKEGAPLRYLTPVETQVPVDVDVSRRYPRYYFADQIVLVRDFDDFVDKTIRRPWSSRVAFLQIEPFAPASGKIISVAERQNEAVLEVESAGRGYLVISITPHRYWKATMDGAVTELIRTNVGYQGMIIPPGRHRIELRYRNPWVVRGAAVSAAALLGLAVMAVMAARMAPPR